MVHDSCPPEWDTCHHSPLLAALQQKAWPCDNSPAAQRSAAQRVLFQRDPGNPLKINAITFHSAGISGLGAPAQVRSKLVEGHRHPFAAGPGWPASEGL